MSSVPLQTALTVLGALASQYPAMQNFQKAVSTPPTTQTTAVPAQSNPVNVPSAPMQNGRNQPTSNAGLGTSPPSKSSSNCDYCRNRPKHFDGKRTHSFCGKGCASKAQAATSGTSKRANPGNCDVCQTRPKYDDGNQIHPFCGKACANISKTKRQVQQTPAAKTVKGTCGIPGCQKPAHPNVNGTPGEYCSVVHKTLAENACLMCRKTEKRAQSNFCGKACKDDAEKKGPMIIEVPTGHINFKSVTDQFTSSWRHSGTVAPTVRRIYKILGTKSSLANYDAYRAAVEARGNFASAGRSAGNENRRWHGTRRECKLGDPGNTQFCASKSCSLCCIVRTSFDLSLFGKKTGWGRFGKGIYTSSTSSKSNDYSRNDTTSPLKAILLNKVVVGKGYKMTQDSSSMTGPPSGYDSVLAEKGGSLNYDELVVYTNDAIRPSYLVMYDE